MVAENITKIYSSSIRCEAKNFSATCWYNRLDVPDALNIGAKINIFVFVIYPEGRRHSFATLAESATNFCFLNEKPWYLDGHIGTN